MKVRPDGAGGYQLVDAGPVNLDDLGLANRFLGHLRAARRSPNTSLAYARDIVHLLSYLTSEGKRLRQFTPSVAQEFFVHLVDKPVRWGSKATSLALVVDGERGPMRKRSGTSVNRTMAAVSSFFEFVIVVGAFENENPIRLINDPAQARVPERHKPFMGGASRQRPVRRALRVQTVTRLARPISADTTNLILANMRSLRNQAILMLMLDGGLRPGEVLGLRLEDIEYGARRVVIRHRDDHPKGVRQKSRSERKVDLLDPRTLAILNKYVMHSRPQGSGSPYVFLIGSGSRRGEPMSYQALQRSFRRLTAKLGVYTPTLTPHAFRHTHATAMWEAGMKELTLQKRLGHASPESMRQYTRITDRAVLDDYRDAMRGRSGPASAERTHK